MRNGPVAKFGLPGCMVGSGSAQKSALASILKNSKKLCFQ